MNEHDTIHLLQECDSGSKMAVSAIEDVLEKTNRSELHDLLMESKQHHEKLGNEIHATLQEHGLEDSSPNPLAKGMAWIKTNFKMNMDPSDETIAKLITEGCDMGINSLQEYMNEYTEADDRSKDLCRRLMSIEDALREDLRDYL